ncbi:unnamed protein product [Discosporangium mesarthrocarpum]
MLKHAQNYNFPRTQKYIVRILFVVPVYAVCSCIAIISQRPHVVVVALTVRDVNEAFVVYSFLTLIVEYAGGDYNCIEQIKHLPPVSHPWPCCCLPAVRRDGTLLRLSKQAALQFVVVKPTMAALSLIALATGQYFAASFQATLLVVYNTSYSISLYGLLLFYQATKPLLTPHKPVQKFFAVKSIIFATYWQSVIIYFIPGLTSQESLLWNDWILCIEMVGFALLLNHAFPWHSFLMGDQDKPVMENVREMLSVRDVFQDAYHSFMPSYQDYVVARDDHDPNASALPGNKSSNVQGKQRKIRTRTFLIGNLDKNKMASSSPCTTEQVNCARESERGQRRKRGVGVTVSILLWGNVTTKAHGKRRKYEEPRRPHPGFSYKDLQQHFPSVELSPSGWVTW